MHKNYIFAGKKSNCLFVHVSVCVWIYVCVFFFRTYSGKKGVKAQPESLSGFVCGWVFAWFV